MSRRMSFERKLVLTLLGLTVPAVLLLLVALIYYSASIYLVALLGLGFSLGIAVGVASIYHKITWQYRTLSNLLEAISAEDFSLRGRRANTGGALAELMAQINALADTLFEQRLKSEETQLLLRKLINQIDVAIIAVDDDGEIHFANPEAGELLRQDAETLAGQSLQAVGAEQLLDSAPDTALSLELPSGTGVYRVQRDSFRESGINYQLIFISDVRHLLRQQERAVWKNLIRVLSHEINNSLTPIRSIAQTLSRSTGTLDLPETAATNLQQGFDIIGERSGRLQQFISAYRELSHLPDPRVETVATVGFFQRICSLFPEHQIVLKMECNESARFDPAQMEQVLINLLKNAVEAGDKNSEVELEVLSSRGELKIAVRDRGCGISSTDNLFTPFFSTKEGGSGIGLVLSRQIIEAHGGELSLHNRSDGLGAVAQIVLPGAAI